jgi:hypothetical protein
VNQNEHKLNSIGDWRLGVEIVEIVDEDEDENEGRGKLSSGGDRTEEEKLWLTAPIATREQPLELW